MALLEQRRTSVPARALWRRDVQRFEVAWVATFHLLVAVALLLLPRNRLVGPSTAAIFGFVPIGVWTAWFAVVGLLALRVVHRSTPDRRGALWAGAFPLLLAWITGFGFGVINGSGSVLGLIVWISQLVWWATLALRLYLGGTEARWGGS